MKFYLLLIYFCFIFSVMAQGDDMLVVNGGVFTPLFGGLEKEVKVEDFKIDAHPVTVSEYLVFLKENPKWQRSNAKRLFADKMYLRSWESDLKVAKDVKLNSPITEVSWFAAKSYCEWKNKRLLTVDEWEYAAMANQTLADARKDSLFNVYILSWYEKPATYKNSVGQTMRNKWGVYDLHGLVWEWTFDFNSIIMTGESRSDKALDRNLFCAAGSVGATDLMNYAAFMRYAFRGSIKANYSLRNLGFRCGKSIDKAAL